MSTKDRRITPKEFAALAGVTVRTLHHYDRLGLLPSARTGAGHRRYVESDRQAVREIAALKSLGIPLKEIAALKRQGSAALAERVRQQRYALEARQRLTTRLIDAIKTFEPAQVSGLTAEWIESVSTIVDEELGRREWEEVARDTLKYRLTLPLETKREWHREWTELFAAVQPALDRDPADPAVQALATRWIALCRKANPSIPITTILRVGRSNLRWVERYSVQPSSAWRDSVQLLTAAAMLQVNRAH